MFLAQENTRSLHLRTRHLSKVPKDVFPLSAGGYLGHEDVINQLHGSQNPVFECKDELISGMAQD
jgi:hypothetical protein